MIWLARVMFMGVVRGIELALRGMFRLVQRGVALARRLRESR